MIDLVFLPKHIIYLKKTKLVIFVLITVLGVSFYFYEELKVSLSIKDDSFNKEAIALDNDVTIDFHLPAKGISQIIQHTIFTLSYNEQHEQAEWVAYKLFKNSINNSVKRKDNFRQDPLIVTESATLSDYKKSGYDRGHLAPAKTMSFSKQTMSESFFMSNMSPQKPSFNRGVWKRLEEKVRQWIQVSDSLYVVTGPVLKDSLGCIGKNNVTIPNAYYKVVIRFKNKNLTGIGFLLNNKKSSERISTFAVAIDSVEEVTDINFFYKLNVEEQDRIEKNTSLDSFLKE